MAKYTINLKCGVLKGKITLDNHPCDELVLPICPFPGGVFPDGVLPAMVFIKERQTGERTWTFSFNRFGA